MAVQRITRKALNALGPGQTLWDDAVKGFGARRQRQAAVYVFKYRDNAGRQHFLTIGRHGNPWTPETARERAVQLLAAHRGRRGGQAKSSIEAEVPTLEAFSQLYLDRYAVLHKKARSIAEDRRNLTAHILPALGDKTLDCISQDDIAEFQVRRSAWASNANRCLALLSHIFTIAGKWGAVPAGTNPCRGMKRFREGRRERFLTAEELARLGTVLTHPLGDAPLEWRSVYVVQLLLYTGARLSEILSLQWGWINWDGGFVRLPDSKTGVKTVPLPDPALHLLRQISQIHGRESKFVFPGTGREKYFTGIQKPWQRIRARAGLDDVRIHDLRHCYASVAVAGGESMSLVGAVLGHRAPATTQRYAHLAIAPILESANRTADRLAALMRAEVRGKPSKE